MVVVPYDKHKVMSSIPVPISCICIYICRCDSCSQLGLGQGGGHHQHHQSLIPTMLRSVTCILFLHSDLSCAKSSNKLHFFRSIFNTSIHILLGLPLPLGGPSTCIAKLLLTSTIIVQCWTCPSHFKQVSLFLSPIDATHKCTQKQSFLILSFLVLPHIHLNIHISAASILSICCFLIGQHYAP